MLWSYTMHVMSNFHHLFGSISYLLTAKVKILFTLSLLPTSLMLLLSLLRSVKAQPHPHFLNAVLLALARDVHTAWSDIYRLYETLGYGPGWNLNYRFYLYLSCINNMKKLIFISNMNKSTTSSVIISGCKTVVRQIRQLYFEIIDFLGSDFE